MQNFDAVIVANGEFPTHDIPLNILRNTPVVISCDGATNNLVAHKVTPHAIIGDLDSIDKGILSAFQDRVIEVKSQDNNDLTKAVNYAKENGYRNVAIVGATGLRADHTIANIFLLPSYMKELNVMIFTDYGHYKAIDKTTRLESFAGQQVSLFATIPQAKITSKGLLYPLNQLQLLYPWMGTLNEATQNHIDLELSEGELIIYQSYLRK